MSRSLAAFIALVIPAAVHAEPSDLRLALAVNAPSSWMFDSFGVSAYVGLTDHQALRANVATHAHRDNPIAAGIGMVIEGDDADGGTPSSGRTTDLGIAWEYFPRRTFDGFFVELGALARFRNTNDYEAAIDTDTLAARGHLGWSWTLPTARPSLRAFVAAAVGVSYGYEWGNETAYMAMSVHRPDLEAEAFLRFGFAFDVALASAHP
jgi:hypothetical protein